MIDDDLDDHDDDQDNHDDDLNVNVKYLQVQWGKSSKAREC